MNPSVGSATATDAERPEHLPSGDLEAIHVIQEDFARHLRMGASAILNLDITVKVIGIRQDTYAGLQKAPSSAAYICATALSPDKRASALHMTSGLVFPVLEAMMGGAIAPCTDSTRRLTVIEEDVLEPFVQMILRALTKSWSPVGEIVFGRGSDLPLAHEKVVAVTVELEIAEDTKGSLTLALPYILLRKLKALAEKQTRPAEPTPVPHNSEAMLKLIQPAMLEFEARLDGPKVGLRDLLNLAEGQIVLLDRAPDGEVDGLLNKSAYFKGQVVSDGKKRLLLIERFREQETA